MSTVVLAFSGGLDTSFCAVWLARQADADVIAVTVDTGGFSAEERDAIGVRAAELGCVEHIIVDARLDVYDRFVSYLILGSVLRGGTYPLSVGCERTAQAEAVVAVALEKGAAGIAHGSTGAGNDQIRFDAAIAALAPDLKIHAPIRDLNWTREQERDWLATQGVTVPDLMVSYSLNEGLFGTTIGGTETHDPWAMPPEEAYTMTTSPTDTPPAAEELVIGFERGLPVSVDGQVLGGVEVIEVLNARSRPHGVGRGVHLGDTILGLKGRIAFEAPAPLLLIGAHKELCKLVLTKWQLHWNEQVGGFYGMLLHEGLFYDPVMRDFEAFLGSANRMVTGDVRIRLHAGHFDVVGVRSPHSLMDAKSGVYGETAGAWDGRDAAGFARIHGLGAALAARRDAAPVPGGGLATEPAGTVRSAT